MAELTSYQAAQAAARAAAGRLGASALRDVIAALEDYAVEVATEIRRLRAGSPAQVDASLTQARRVTLAATKRLQDLLVRIVSQHRTASYDEVASIWRETTLKLAELENVPDALLGGVRTPSINLQGAYERLNPKNTWRTVIRSSAIDAANEVNAIIRRGLANGLSPNQIAQLIKPYMRGAEPFYQAFGTTDAKKINWEGVPRDAQKRLMNNARRIAFSETHNARAEAELAGFAADPLVIGVRWDLAPNRGTLKQPDICDVFAHTDYYGMGPGIYPVDKVPAPPHPWDRCERFPIKRNVKDVAKPKPSPPKQSDITVSYGPNSKMLTPADKSRIEDQASAVLNGTARLPVTGQIRAEMADHAERGLTVTHFTPPPMPTMNFVDPVEFPLAGRGGLPLARGAAWRDLSDPMARERLLQEVRADPTLYDEDQWISMQAVRELDAIATDSRFVLRTNTKAYFGLSDSWSALEKKLANGVLVNPGVRTLTIDESRVSAYAGSHGTVIEVELPKGARAASAKVSGLDELQLLPGSRYHIVSVARRGELTYVTARLVDDGTTTTRAIVQFKKELAAVAHRTVPSLSPDAILPPSNVRSGARAYIRELLQKGHTDVEAIVAAAKQHFPNVKITVTDVKWQRDHVLKIGKTPPPPTKPSVEPQELPPPSNPRAGARAYIRELLTAGHRDVDAIVAAAAKEFPRVKITAVDVKWQRDKVLKLGQGPEPKPAAPPTPTITRLTREQRQKVRSFADLGFDTVDRSRYIAAAPLDNTPANRAKSVARYREYWKPYLSPSNYRFIVSANQKACVRAHAFGLNYEGDIELRRDVWDYGLSALNGGEMTRQSRRALHTWTHEALHSVSGMQGSYTNLYLGEAHRFMEEGMVDFFALRTSAQLDGKEAYAYVDEQFASGGATPLTIRSSYIDEVMLFRRVSELPGGEEVIARAFVTSDPAERVQLLAPKIRQVVDANAFLRAKYADFLHSLHVLMAKSL